MIRRAFVMFTLALAAGLGASSTVAQSPPNTVALQPSPDIPGVIAGGTMPEVVIKGLTSSDDPLWLPDVGLIFSEFAGQPHRAAGRARPARHVHRRSAQPAWHDRRRAGPDHFDPDEARFDGTSRGVAERAKRKSSRRIGRARLSAVRTTSSPTRKAACTSRTRRAMPRAARLPRCTTCRLAAN